MQCSEVGCLSNSGLLNLSLSCDHNLNQAMPPNVTELSLSVLLGLHMSVRRICISRFQLPGCIEPLVDS